MGTALLAAGTMARMWGRETIEWQDRSWRLLGSKGQVECDDWTYSGMAGSAVVLATKGIKLGWRGAVGMIGPGSLVGMMGYMGW
jgi:hypothetical protein